MASEPRRIEMHIEADRKSRAVVARCVSAFVREGAAREADRVLAVSEPTRMPAEQFDALLNSLDSPDLAPALVAAAADPRRFSRE